MHNKRKGFISKYSHLIEYIIIYYLIILPIITNLKFGFQIVLFNYDDLIILLLSIIALTITLVTVIYSSNKEIIEKLHSVIKAPDKYNRIMILIMGIQKDIKSDIARMFICLLVIIIMIILDSIFNNNIMNSIFNSLKLSIFLYTLLQIFLIVKAVLNLLDIELLLKKVQ